MLHFLKVKVAWSLVSDPEVVEIVLVGVDRGAGVDAEPDHVGLNLHQEC